MTRMMWLLAPLATRMPEPIASTRSWLRFRRSPPSSLPSTPRSMRCAPSGSRVPTWSPPEQPGSATAPACSGRLRAGTPSCSPRSESVADDGQQAPDRPGVVAQPFACLMDGTEQAEQLGGGDVRPNPAGALGLVQQQGECVVQMCARGCQPLVHIDADSGQRLAKGSVAPASVAE